MKGKVSGLCGKYNGDPSDDLETQDKQVVSSVADFANSWRKTGIDASMDLVYLNSFIAWMCLLSWYWNNLYSIHEHAYIIIYHWKIPF